MPRPTFLLIPFIAALAGLTILAWWLPNRPRFADLPMPDARFNAISFAPFRAGQSPLTGQFPTRAEVEQDVAHLAHSVAALRTYAAHEGDYEVAAIAQAHGLKLWQGIWLGADRAKNAAEIAHGIDIARRYPQTVDRLIVGNEVLLRRDLPAAELAADIDQVRAAVHTRVTYADVWEFWEQYPEIADHVDIVTIHILPYWEDNPTAIDGAITHVHDIYRRIAARFPHHPIAIGETGWPSRGRWRRDAAPSLVNQAVFLRRFVALAKQERFDYCVIEAFDQTWKYKNEGTVGANWGLWTASRRAKFPLTGPLIENPNWPGDAALSLLFGLVLLLANHSLIRTAPGRVPFALIALAFALGDGYGFAWAATLPEIYDLHLRIAAFGNLAGQALLALLLMRRAGAILSGKTPPWRSGADCADRIRKPKSWPDMVRTPQTLFPDLTFLFAWTAAFLQLLLVFDPRYRDFPLPCFAIPLIAIAVRALLRDLPRRGGGREEKLVAATLIIGAIASTWMEGTANLQALTWNAAAIILAVPLLMMCARPASP